MTVKQLMKVSIATRVEITEKTENGYEIHNVDILEYDIVEAYPGFTDYPSYVLLPDRVLSAKVRLISINPVTGGLQISI